MSHFFFRHLLLLLLATVSVFVNAKPLLPQEVPEPLQPWINWVLYGQQTAHCPFFYNQALNDGKISPICYWASHLKLEVTAHQVQFQQTWRVYQANWVALPGNAKVWPQEVKINGAAVLVADRDGIPSVFLPEGEMSLTGQFTWQHRPENLQIPRHTGLIELSIEGTPVAIPKVDENGLLWLRQRGTQSEEDAAEENRLDMRVYRLFMDEIPLQLVTRIEMDVAGRHREVVLGPAMLAHHLPMSLESPLPTRLEPDGRLRVQVRPGSWVLNLHTRQTGQTDRLGLPPLQANQTTLWVNEEIWAFAARHELRLVEISGVAAIDPQQTTLPAEWRQFPAYQVKAGDTLELIEKRRGDPEPIPDRLQLKRHYWLDFDGKGYTIQDYVSGTMTQGWRLEMNQPAVLGRVNVNGQDQLITRLPQNANLMGVEVRRGNIDLNADSRLEGELTTLPAVGWAHDFHQVNATLHLPPGWRLLNTKGVDNIHDTWLKQWTLLDLFIVLITSLAIGKLWRWYWGVLTLLTLILIFQENQAPQWIWLHVLAALALLRLLPTLGWFSQFVRFYRNLALLSLMIIAIPFMVQQARQSLYPQLEYSWIQLGNSSTYSDSGASVAGASVEVGGQLNVETPAPPPPNEAFDQVVEQQVIKKRADSVNFFDYEEPVQSKVARKPLAQIDPNAQVQTGPGLPQWQWRNIEMSWQGPVEAEQTVQLWLIPPNLNTILGLSRILLLSALIAFLIWQSWNINLRLFSLSESKVPNAHP